MSPELQPVIDAPGLEILEDGQIGDGGRLSFVEDVASHGLQGLPSRPLELGRVGDLSQRAAPLDNSAVDIPCPEQVRYPCMLVRRVPMNGGDHLLGANAILGRDSVLKVTRKRLQPELFMADVGQSARPSVILSAEPKTTVQIGQVVY